MAEQFISVEVAYATPERQLILTATVPLGATVEEAINTSGMLKHFPDIDLEKNKVGIFSTACKLDRVLEEGDRVEIYRPLLHDPKESRKKRAAKSEA